MQANFSNTVALWFPSQSAVSHLKQKRRMIPERNLFYNGEFMEGLTALTATKIDLIFKFSTLPLLLLSRQELSPSEKAFLPLACISRGWTETRAHIKISDNGHIWWPCWVTPRVQTGRAWMLGTRNTNLGTSFKNSLFHIEAHFCLQTPSLSPKKRD